MLPYGGQGRVSLIGHCLMGGRGGVTPRTLPYGAGGHSYNIALWCRGGGHY